MAGEGIHRLIVECESERRLVGLAPLKETRDRDQAAALMQRCAPKAAALEVVDASIEGGAFGVGTSGAEAD